MPDKSDVELVVLSQQGNKAAFGVLVSRYQPMAQRLATRVVGNKDLAQELVQEAMLQAYLSLKKLNDPARFKSWLYGIVLNVCRNNLRRRKLVYFSLEAMIGNLIDEPLSVVGSFPDPQLVAEQEELHAAIHNAVDTLSPKNKSVVLLFYNEQFSLQEVAKRLNISVNAVKGRLHKSRHQLREQLSPLTEQIQPTLIKETKTMTSSTASKAKTEFCCSFCHKSQEQVNILIAGPNVFICDTCVNICNQIISGQIPPLSQEQVDKLMDSGKLSD